MRALRYPTEFAGSSNFGTINSFNPLSGCEFLSNAHDKLSPIMCLLHLYGPQFGDKKKADMKLKFKDVFIGLFALILLICVGYYWFSPTELQQAPMLDFKIVDGRTLSLSQLKGQPVLVVFWATSCVGCIKEMPHLIELYQELAPRGLEIIAVAMAYDPPNQVMEMRRRKQIPYPIALDIQGDVASAFGDVRLTPTTFLINSQGQVAFQKTGMLNMIRMRQKVLSMLPASQGG